MKIILNILLILVLLVTVLPVKQVGNALFNRQWTQELKEDPEEQSEGKSPLVKWALLAVATPFHLRYNILVQQAFSLGGFSQELPPSPFGDILSPPPKYFNSTLQ